MIGHVIERFVIHLFSSYGLVCGVWFCLSIVRKRAPRWLPDGWLALLVISALFVALCGFVREPWDATQVGDPWWKSYTDFASWIIGSALACFGQYRFYYRVLRWSD